MRLLILFTLLFNGSVFAGVNLKNGNFYVSYTDIEMGDFRGAISSITRTYNSISTVVGLFGRGWGSHFESRLYAYPDGTITIREHGSGGSTDFRSEFATEEDLEAMIDQLIETAISQNDLDNIPQKIIQQREKYMTNLEFRKSHWNKYAKRGLLEFVTDFPEGMKWITHDRGNQTIVKTLNGYLRIQGKDTDEFDNEGNLTKIELGDGRTTEMEYKKGRLSKIIQQDGTVLIVTTNDDGLITKIKSPFGSSSYTYDGLDLIKTEDVDKNMYLHVYDTHYNMTSIEYDDGSFMRMEYDPKNSMITRLIDRDGDTVDYAYMVFYHEDGSIDDDHYGTKVTKTGWDGKKVTNTYEYNVEVRSDGDRYTEMIRTEIDGITTETHYDELCGEPLTIKRGAHETTFKYNNRCLLTEKLSTRGDFSKITYHDAFDKILQVENNEGITKFEYDSDQNLTKASKDTTVIELFYNEKGKIIKMVQSENVMTFEYNELGKPSQIVLNGIGSIQVEYDKFGEITKVESEGGHKIALQVTQSFQELLSIVKPAGVNLNM